MNLRSVLLVGVVLLSLPPLEVHGAVFNVPNGDVTVLKSAINIANSNGQSDTINLAAGGLYLLTTVDNTTNGAAGLPVVGADGANTVTINGNGATIRRGAGAPAFRHLSIAASATLVVDRVTLADGSIVGANGSGSGQPGLVGAGGAIRNQGTLMLTNCTLSGNQARGGGGANHPSGTGGTGGAGQGGAIFNTGTVTLSRCTLSGNSAVGGLAGNSSFGFSGGTGGIGQGGGVFQSAGTATLTNCTVSGNTVIGGMGGDGELGGTGGNSNGSGIAAQTALTLTNCSVSSNTATGGPGGFGDTQASSGFGFGGGLWRSAGTTTVRASIVAGNSANSGPDNSGAFTSAGFNLIGRNDGGTGFTNGVNNDLVGTAAVPINPLLGALQKNGGPTATRALLSGSPAIDNGDDTVLNAPLSLTTDQRGLPRSLGAGVDIGAFEFDAPQSGPNFTVNTTDEHDDTSCGVVDCTLLEALNAANASNDVNTVTFIPGLNGTITNSIAAGLTVSNPATIIGPGARILAISGNNTSRVFNILSTVTISGLTIRDGLLAGTAGGGAALGGGISNGGTLTLTNCALINNIARGGLGAAGGGSGGLARGGAIYNQATLTLNSCALSGNSAQGNDGGFSGLGGNGGVGGVGQGGAIYQALTGSSQLNNCTLNGNTATGGKGGGAEGGADGLAGNGGNGNGGGIAILTAVTVTDCTVSGNTATGGAAGIDNNSIPATSGTGTGGGLWRTSGTATIRGTIVAGNTVLVGTATGADVFGAFISGDYNLIQNTTGATFTGSTTHHITGVNPLLSALANNGGPTDTMALALNSPAIDHGLSFSLTNDQRGLLRTADGVPANAGGGDGTDIGAFEFHPGAGVDSDGDGMSDQFESFYGVSDPNGDADGDGQTNLQEFLAGTNPINSTSALRILAIQSSGSDILITFAAVGQKSYRLERKGALSDVSWQSIGGVVDVNPAATGVVSITHPGGANAAPGFYRVRLLP